MNMEEYSLKYRQSSKIILCNMYPVGLANTRISTDYSPKPPRSPFPMNEITLRAPWPWSWVTTFSRPRSNSKAKPPQKWLHIYLPCKILTLGDRGLLSQCNLKAILRGPLLFTNRSARNKWCLGTQDVRTPCVRPSDFLHCVMGVM